MRLALVCFCILAGTAKAELIIGYRNLAGNNTVATVSGSTGNVIEMYVQNTGPSAVNIAGFSLAVQSPAISGISFPTEPTISTTTATYIFNGNSFFNGDLSTDTFPQGAGSQFTLSDLHASTFTTIASGQTFGLARLVFDVAGTATTGVYDILLRSSVATSLSDENFSNLTISNTDPGRISINVPEPGSIILAGLATALLGGGSYRSWRRSKRQSTAAIVA